MRRALLLRLVLVGLLASMLLAAVPSATAQPGNSFGREKAPETTFRDFHILGDENGPGRMISNDWNQAGFVIRWDPLCGVPFYSSVVRGISGVNGSREWTKDLGLWHKFPGPHCGRYFPPIQLGWPEPYHTTFGWGLANGPGTPVDNVQTTSDVNGDGVDDFVTYGWRFSGCPAGECFDGELNGRDGATGDPLWSRTINATRSPGTPWEVKRWPTGLIVYNDPTGPRFAWKTTDLTYIGSTGTYIWQDKVEIGDTRNGDIIWSYTFLNVTQYVLQRYLVGPAQLDSSPEYEMVLSSWAPPGCLACPPDALDVVTLKGQKVVNAPVPGVIEERILWGPNSCYVPPQRGNDQKQTEETREHTLYSHIQVIGDVTDDGRPETVCKYRTVNVGGGNGDVSSNNGRIRAHIQPLDGYNGNLMWAGADIKQQGWGFVSDVNEPITYRYESWGSLPTGDSADKSKPFIGLGTADLAQGTGRGGKYPPKDTRLSVLAVKDGGPVWGTYVEPLAQNDNSLIMWALKQYATTLAGHDYNGDGMRELLSAAAYPIYPDNYQVLISTTHFKINIVDADKGDVLRVIQPWGPKGMVVPCPGDSPDDITILSGHARRIDMHRYNGFTDSLNWREPWYLNPRAQAQTAGIGFNYIAPRCGDTPDSRTGIGYSAGMASFRRGGEVLPVYGYVNETGGLAWLQPDLPYRPPMNASLEPYLNMVVPPPALKETVGMSLLSVTGGVGAAFASVTIFNARRKALAAAA